MTHTQNIHVVFGTGGLGLSTMRVLHAAGKQVRLVNRHGKVNAALPAGVEIVAGDARDAHSMRQASAGAVAMYNCIGLPYTAWQSQWPDIQSNLLTAAAAHRARFIFGDNLYMYGDTNGAPVDENSPTSAKTRKGRLRAALAQQVLEAHTAGRVQAAIVRGSDFFGPHVEDTGLLGTRSIGALIAGKPALFIGNIDQPHTFTFIDDFGCAMARAAEHDAALGQVWHAPNPETLTVRQIMMQFGAVLGVTPKFQVLGRLPLKLLGLFSAQMRELPEMLYSWEKPYVVKSDKISQQLGLSATPWREAVAKTLRWYQDR